MKHRDLNEVLQTHRTLKIHNFEYIIIIIIIETGFKIEVL